MGDKSREPAQILDQARETLKTAQRGYADFVGNDPERRLSGLRNAIVFGRAVTNVIENLRGKVPDFDGWYKPQSAKLAENLQFRRLYQLRSEILKQGIIAANHSFTVNYLNTDDLAPIMSNPPAGARDFFMGDSAGGSGWDVELPDGEIVQYYVNLPGSIEVSHAHTIRVAGEDLPAGPLIDSYLQQMSSLIAEARMKFL